MSPLRRAWSVLWRICLFFLLWALLLAPLIVPLGSWLEKTRHTSPHLSRLCMEMMVVVTVLGATWIMVCWIERRRFVTAGFEPRHALRDLSVGVLIGACWVAASTLPLLIGDVASFQASPAWSATLGWSGLAIFLNAVAQEVLARGYLFQLVRSATTPSLAILVSSLLFTALHAGAFDRLGFPVLNVFLAGVLFGLSYLLTGNLWLPISIHFSWNWEWFSAQRSVGKRSVGTRRRFNFPVRRSGPADPSAWRAASWSRSSPQVCVWDFSVAYEPR